MRNQIRWGLIGALTLTLLGCTHSTDGSEPGVDGSTSNGGRSDDDATFKPTGMCAGAGELDTRPGQLFNMTYSSDGSLVATASPSRRPNIMIFRASDNALLLEIEGHEFGTYGVAFSPDGSLLASAGAVTNDSAQLKPGGVKIWRVSDGSFVGDIPVDPSPVTSGVEFSHDGSLLATAANSAVELWRVSDFTRVLSIPHHNAYSVHFSTDDSLLAADGSDMLARVWRVADGSLLSTMAGHTYFVQDAEFSPDGTQLATAAEDDTTRIWDVATGKQLQVLRQSTYNLYVNDVLWYDSNRLITSDWQAGLRIWARGANGEFEPECERWTGGSQALALSPDRSELRAGGSDKPPMEWRGGNYHGGMWIFR